MRKLFVPDAPHAVRAAYCAGGILSLLLSAGFTSMAWAEPPFTAKAPKETTPIKYFSNGGFNNSPSALSSKSLGAGPQLESKAGRSYRLNEEGVELVFKGKKLEGKRKIEAAIEHNPENATALYNLAGLELAASHPKEAIALMERALVIHPQDPAFLNRFAESHFANSDIKQAVAQYEKIVAVDPGFGEVMSRLGTLYGMLRQWEKAEDTLKKAVAQHPKDAQALANLGNILVLREKFADAVEVLNRAQALKPGKENLVALGIAYDSLKQPDMALAKYREAKSLGDRDPELERHITELEQQLAGSPAAAKSVGSPSNTASTQDRSTGSR